MLRQYTDAPIDTFILRELWLPVVGETDQKWWSALPKRYSEKRVEYHWLTDSTKVLGHPTDAGLHALAELLVSMRAKQREEEEA